ncbi:MAG: hypothetical protein ACR2LT_06010 [Pyrinomonadaceae bacterium]
MLRFKLRLPICRNDQLTAFLINDHFNASQSSGGAVGSKGFSYL